MVWVQKRYSHTHLGLKMVSHEEAVRVYVCMVIVKCPKCNFGNKEQVKRAVWMQIIAPANAMPCVKILMS